MCKIPFRTVVFFCIATALSCAKSGVNTQVQNTSPSVNSLKIVSAAGTGFSQVADADSFVIYTPENLNLAINGGNVEYIDRGLIAASAQNFTSADSRTMRSLCMDFGTAAKASAMYAYKKASVTAALTIPSFDSSVAVGKPEILFQGITAFAWFDRFYFEIRLLGYADQTQALGNAAVFLSQYASKIQTK